jgi:hypothetical protein
MFHAQLGQEAIGFVKVEGTPILKMGGMPGHMGRRYRFAGIQITENK